MPQKLHVEIQRASTDPSNTMLEVYIVDETLPICTIWEEDFVELLTDRQYKLMEKGANRFYMFRDPLVNACKHWFNMYR